MKKKTLYISLISGVISMPVLAGPFAPAANQPGTTAISKDDAAITSWATGFENYLVGPNVDASFQTPNNAVGAATSSPSTVSLGEGGQITMTFLDAIVNGVGDDFAIFENSFSHTFLELARVEVSSNGTDFFGFPVISLTPSSVGPFGSIDATDIDGFAGKYIRGFGTGFDLESLSGIADLDIFDVSYVRLLDVVGDGSEFDDSITPNPIYDPTLTLGSGGFDLDAIGVLNSASTVVPVPASIWLFASGVLALGAFRKKSFTQKI